MCSLTRSLWLVIECVANHKLCPVIIIVYAVSHPQVSVDAKRHVQRPQTATQRNVADYHQLQCVPSTPSKQKMTSCSPSLANPISRRITHITSHTSHADPSLNSSSPFSPHINPIRPWLLFTLGQASNKWGSGKFCTQPALRPLTKCNAGIIAAYLSFKPQSISSRSVTPMNLSHPSIRYQEHCKLRTQLEHTNPSQVGTITSQLSVGLCFEILHTNS